MKSNLKKIYDAKEGFNILNSPSYYFTTNPIYQVNKFITSIDPNLNKNFIENLKDLKINYQKAGICKSDYEYVTNTIYSHDNISDVFGLLHVASNDKNKKYTGIITEYVNGKEMGYGLNNGLTEVFTNQINKKSFAYPLEATIAKVLLILDPNTVTYSYFNNDGKKLLNMNKKMDILLTCLDCYHDNFVELLIAYNERFVRNYFKLKTNSQKQKSKLLEEKIHKIEINNFTNVYYVFDTLNTIIDSSNIEEEKKQDLYISLYNEFNAMFMSEEFRYLKELPLEFEKNIYERKNNVKCKKLNY